MAAGYFLGRGFRNFGCFGHARSMVSRGRGEGFRAGLAEAGQRCRFFLEDCPEADLGTEERYEAGIERWLRGLAKPAAVFAPSDFSSRQLARACRRRGLRVPEEVALLGVDNDDLLCYAAHVPLSSIAVPGERIGRLAAAWLEGMLEGRRPPVAPVLFPPLEVVTRASTDLLAEPDEVVRAALAAMRAPAQPAQSVKELLGVVPASRCTLERRFRAALGRPPGEELRRLRLEKAKELLGGTELSLSEVAGGAGYGSAQWLCAVFRRRVGMTPGRYRAWFRSGKNNGG
jgi:LacI family transcriptional regulator